MSSNAYLCRLRRSCPHVPDHLAGRFDPVPTGPSRAERRAGKATVALGGLAVGVPAALAASSSVASAAPPPPPAPTRPLPLRRLPSLTGWAHVAAPIVGMSAAPQGNGYWEVGGDGGVFTFGDAGYYGSAASIHLDQPDRRHRRHARTARVTGWPYRRGRLRLRRRRLLRVGGIDACQPAVVGIMATPDGDGYWLVGADGGVFAFGDAGYYGSAAGVSISPIVGGLAPRRTARGTGRPRRTAPSTPSATPPSAVGPPRPRPSWASRPRATATVWSVADGGVLDFGDAAYFGSMAGQELTKPVVGMAAAPDARVLGGRCRRRHLQLRRRRPRTDRSAAARWPHRLLLRHRPRHALPPRVSQRRCP